MAKRKMRKYDEGGPVDDSEALADENYGDNTTRAERLAMTRGAAPVSRNEGNPGPTRGLNDDMYSDYGPAAGRVSSETTSAPVARAAAKTPVVTKEQLAASGLSLRDYLNKQQGLTRRGEPSGAIYSNEGRSRPAPAPANPNYSNEGRGRPGPARQETMQDRAERYVAKRAVERAKDMEERASERSKAPTSRPKASEQKFMGSLKFSGGGSVSASKRADGIAQRGKTRGKIC